MLGDLKIEIINILQNYNFKMNWQKNCDGTVKNIREQKINENYGIK